LAMLARTARIKYAIAIVRYMSYQLSFRRPKDQWSSLFRQVNYNPNHKYYRPLAPIFAVALNSTLTAQSAALDTPPQSR
jgi:uncharacterized membrane protein